MLIKLDVLLAALDPVLLDTKPSKGFTLNLQDTLLIIGVGCGLGFVLFLWVYLARKRHRDNSISRSSVSSDRNDTEEGPSSSGKIRYRKKRRRHPDSRPRNPSLGETGGLPPLRPEDPSEPHS